MTNREKIIATLKGAELCDDCLSVSSGVSPRNSVNQECRRLSERSIVIRRSDKCPQCRGNKIVNRLADGMTIKSEMVRAKQEVQLSETTGVPAWYWEGNVQSRVVAYLATQGYLIQRVADTASREAGKDIVAVTPDGRELWVSVKGYPEKSANTQARHWFSGAVFDLVLYRGENPNVRLALALPDGFTTFANLAPRVQWLKQTMPFEIIWVSEDGNVRVE